MQESVPMSISTIVQPGVSLEKPTCPICTEPIQFPLSRDQVHITCLDCHVQELNTYLWIDYQVDHSHQNINIWNRYERFREQPSMCCICRHKGPVDILRDQTLLQSTWPELLADDCYIKCPFGCNVELSYEGMWQHVRDMTCPDVKIICRKCNQKLSFVPGFEHTIATRHQYTCQGFSCDKCPMSFRPIGFTFLEYQRHYRVVHQPFIDEFIAMQRKMSWMIANTNLHDLASLQNIQGMAFWKLVLDGVVQPNSNSPIPYNISPSSSSLDSGDDDNDD
jgi:hypothetical protein